MDKLFRVLKARPTMFPYVILCILFTSIFLEKNNFKEILHGWNSGIDLLR
jgi:hypothetical protein